MHPTFFIFYTGYFFFLNSIYDTSLLHVFSQSPNQQLVNSKTVL